jgi:hypothetical protein
MIYIISIPVLAIVIAAYLLAAFGGGMMLDADAYSLALPSGAVMTLRFGDIFVVAGVLALWIEMLKAARAGRGTILDHILSTGVFVAALLCFLLLEFAGTGTFLILTVMTLIDVVAGFSISIFATRRDFTLDR